MENTISNILSKNLKLVLGIGDYYYSDYYNENLGMEPLLMQRNAGLK
jgi:hypothetical protein